MKTSRPLILLVLMLMVGMPLGFLVEYFAAKTPLGRQIPLPTYYIFLFAVSAVAAKVFDILFEKWIGRIAARIDNWVVSAFSGSEKRYLEYLTNSYRDFDTRGLTVQGDFNLELDKVYVELKLEEQIASEAKASGTIWEFLNSTNKEPIRLVILGSPGSGRTTLLRYVTRVLSNRRKYASNADLFDQSNLPTFPVRLPMLLTLRRHAQAICDNPNFPLSDAISSTLTGMDKALSPEWLTLQLCKGRCIVMLDGLDEIADPYRRDNITEWIQEQIAEYPNNHFVITSRPYGYQTSPLSGVRVFAIKQFTSQQIKLFVEKWYLANEIMRNNNKDDSGVRLKAKENAADLMQRLQANPEITNFAVNPLLITMIATVHSFKVKLPGRRVELYRDIFDVFLQRRRNIIWLNVRLSIDQQLDVLRLMAYHMMVNKLREISKNEAIVLIQQELTKIDPHLTGGAFLRNVEEQSGLLLEAGVDHYQFAHLTFQEYLAAEHIRSDHTGNRLKDLLETVNDTWWAETTRLYAARADATAIIRACLREDPPSAPALSLAMDCLTEAKRIEPEVRARLEKILDQSIESTEPRRRALAAEAKLSSRLRWMSHLGSGRYIDTDLVTNVEYQLFLDEMQQRDKHYQPDHWENIKFPEGDGNEPIVGARPQDAARFCEWLTGRDIWHAKYRIPTIEEAHSFGIEREGQIAYWVSSNNEMALCFHQRAPAQFELSQSVVVRQLGDDLDKLIRLRDGAKRRSMPRKTAAELVAGKYPLALGSTPSTRKTLGVPGREHEIEMYFLKEWENVRLLTAYEAYSNNLILGLDDVIQTSARLSLETREDEKRFIDWLPVRHDYQRDGFNLENRFELTIAFFNSTELQNQVDESFKAFVDGLSRALTSLRMRKWAESTFEDSRTRGDVHKFLRWYARLCACCLAVTGREQPLARTGIQKVIMTICEDLVVDLVFLEERVYRRQQPCEGIRLVKVEVS